MRVQIELGKSIIPRGQTKPVSMVFIESSDQNPSKIANTLLRAYLFFTRQALDEHDLQCREDCAWYEMHKEVVESASPITARYNDGE